MILVGACPRVGNHASFLSATFCNPAACPRLFLSQPQVISPMRKGPAGTGTLNPMLQALLNPPRPGKAELLRHSAAVSATSSSDDSGSGSGSGPASAPAHQEAAKVFRVGDRVIQQVGPCVCSFVSSCRCPSLGLVHRKARGAYLVVRTQWLLVSASARTRGIPPSPAAGQQLRQGRVQRRPGHGA